MRSRQDKIDALRAEVERLNGLLDEVGRAKVTWLSGKETWADSHMAARLAAILARRKKEADDD